MEILARFTHETLDHTQDNTVHFVVSLKAPTLDWMAKRPKLCVLPVIDLSGSMKGGKLRYAKESMLKLVDQLADGDFAGLIGFESRVHVLVEPQPVTGDVKDRLKKAINDLQTMGGTNFAEGMMKAVSAVQKLDLPAAFLKRVIIFTDGQPTEGVTDPKMILKMLDSNRGSVTVSSFGYGDVGGGTWNGCDQDFLLQFSELGKGNYAYVKNPDDALAAFGKELGGLLSTYGTDLEVEVEPVNGHLISKVVSNIEHVEDKLTGAIEVPIPDILCEETRHFVFEAKLAKQAKAFPRETTAFNVKLTYSVLTADGKKEKKTLEEKARVRFVKPSDAQKIPNAEVLDIVNLHRVIRAQLDAEEKAKKGQYGEAAKVMDFIAEQVQTNGGAGGQRLAAVARNVRMRVDSADAYSNGQGYLKSLAKGGTRAYGTSSMDADAGADLIACNVSVSNSSQAMYSSSFSNNPVGEVSVAHIGDAPLTAHTTGILPATSAYGPAWASLVAPIEAPVEGTITASAGVLVDAAGAPIDLSAWMAANANKSG